MCLSLQNKANSITQEAPWFWTPSEHTSYIENSILRFSDRKYPILIVGETGSGKELVAKRLYQQRCEQLSLNPNEAPFLAVNSAAIPNELAESMLFGHERGAFTSARERQLGKFELARNGVLFLDEIQTLSPNIQSSLLRALQSREADRIGSKKSYTIHCQIIAACNVPLEKLVESGNFRRDLYYRLNTFPIYLAPLRVRLKKEPEIIERLMSSLCQEHRLAPKTLSSTCLKELLRYSWPGNFRELEHALLRAHMVSSGKHIEVQDLPQHITGQLHSYIQNGLWN